MIALTKQQKILGGAVLAVVIILLIIFLTRLGGGQKALAVAATRLMKAESLHEKMELVIHLPERLGRIDRPFTLITMRVEGDMQQADDSTPEIGGTLFVEAKGRGNVFFADGEIRVLKDEVLFNLDNLPVFLNASGNLVKRWTKVNTSVLTTDNGDMVRQVLEAVLSGLRYVGKEKINGERLTRFGGALSAEQEEQLAIVLNRSYSGNPALHQIARMLQAHNVKSLDVWVDTGAKEIRKISVHFVHPLSDNREFDFATLTLELTDYGKAVTIDRPAPQLSVRPEVFARLFGTGEVEEITISDQ